MSSFNTQRIKNATVMAGLPALRGNLKRARAAGLETLLDYQRLAMLVAAIRYTSEVSGDVIEFGTFRGGSAGVIIQELAGCKTLHVCDSFAGMPDVAPEDNFHRKGDFSETSESRVRNGLSKLGDNFRMHIGFFQDSIKDLEKDTKLKLSFAHIDVDLYESVKDCLEFCYPRMAKGGIIILDDYGAPTCLGGKKAADEFFADKTETIVPLSQPANGCLVGGGNAFSTLLPYCGFVAGLPFIRNRVFDRSN